jgi:hypothetical protein
VFVSGSGLTPQRFSFLFDNYHASPTIADELDGRPYVSVAMFWGGRWVRYVGRPDLLTGLDREQASQHGPCSVQLTDEHLQTLREAGIQVL